METRLYAYFEKVEGKWVRKSAYAYRKSSAVRIFQGRLLGGCFSGKTVGLRVVKLEHDPAVQVS